MNSLVRFLSTSTNTKRHYDVIVSGGGMIGTAMSCLLAKTPLFNDYSILLIEPTKPKQWALQPTHSNRVSSVNRGTKELMEQLGAWDHISKARFKPVKDMKVWDCSGAFVEFDNNGVDPVAYIIENDILVDAVEKELKNTSNVTVMNGAKVEDYKLPPTSFEPVELQMNDGSVVSCNLLIGADGANSQVRRTMGGQYLSWAYGQTAVVATLRLAEGSQNSTAWQRFLSSGPVALLPLTDDLVSLVWSTSTEQAKSLLQLPNDSFVDALNDALWKEPVRLEAVNAVNSLVRQVLGLVEPSAKNAPQPPNVSSVVDGSRAAFPLAFGHATSYVAPCVALIGDAAHKVHPLAGQGVNLGYGDVKCLVDQLSQSVQLGKPLGDLTTLQEYQRQRQLHNVPMMVAIDLMARVYSSQNPALMAAGNIALQVANSVHPIKNLMMSQAAS